MIVCDTGPLVAAAFYRDANHHRCVESFTGLHLANRQTLVPAPIVAEVGYLLGTRADARTEASFLRAVAVGDFVPVDLAGADYDRMVTEVATLDHRHFTVVRPRHVKALTLLP